MKALKTGFLLLCVAGNIYAQKNNVETASIDITKYVSRSEESGDARSAYLKEAKEYIDKAHDHETTSNYEKMWFVRGKVYYYISVDTLGNKGLDADASKKAVESFLNAKKTDAKGKYEKEINNYLAAATAQAFNEGIVAYQANKYDRAMEYYELCIKAIKEQDPAKLKRFNLDLNKVRRYATYVAFKKENMAMAKEYLEVLIAEAYADPEIYVDMRTVLLDQKDTAQALEVLEKGRKMYPDNQRLIDVELNTYIVLGKTDVLIDRLSKAIEVDPYNEHYYFNRGVLFQGIAGDSLTKPADVEAYEDKAIADFEKVLELNPQHYDALYSLGNLYLIRGNRYGAEADKYGFKEKAKSEEFAKKALNQYEKSLPYLELAYEINNSDSQLVQVLKGVYIRTENTEKYKKLKEELGE